MTLGRAELFWALGTLCVAVAAFFLFRTPEPARTGLELVAAACGGAEERRALMQRHVAEPLEVTWLDVSDMGGERRYSRQELERELARLNAVRPACTFSLQNWSIRPHTGGAQWLEGSLEYSDSEATDLHGQRRALRLLFREMDGEQRLERVILGALERRLPEARP